MRAQSVLDLGELLGNLRRLARGAGGRPRRGAGGLMARPSGSGRKMPRVETIWDMSYEQALDRIQSFFGKSVSVVVAGLRDDGPTAVMGMSGVVGPGQPEWDVMDFANRSVDHGQAPPVFYLDGGQDEGRLVALIVPRPRFEGAMDQGDDGLTILLGGATVTIHLDGREEGSS